VGETLLIIQGLKVTYSSAGGHAVRALDGIGLEIGDGEVLGILGESGSGKSTLACALLRLLPPNARCDGGEIRFRGRNLLELPEADLRRIRGRELSLVPQDPALSLNPVMTVGSQIAEVLRSHAPCGTAERCQRVRELLAQVGFDSPEEIQRAYPHQLSGGQRQRVVIAQAVACRPALIIADEPTSKLDPAVRADIGKLLSEIRRQYRTAILLISHDPALLAGYADRVAVMYAGRIVESGDCAETLARPLHPYTQGLVAIARSMSLNAAARARFSVIEGDSPDPAVVVAGCRFEPRCSERMEICACQFPPEVAPENARSVSCFKYAE